MRTMNEPLRQMLRIVPITLSAIVLSACGGSGSESGSSTGTASFAVTDGPSDQVSNVWVTFDRIAIKPADGQAQSFTLDEPQQIDLMTLQGTSARPLIENIEVPAGRYNWVRLYVVGGAPDSYVVETDNGGEYDLFVPGNQPQSNNPHQRWIQLSSPFAVPAGGHADFVIDVDLRKALVKKDQRSLPAPYYMIRPSLRIVDELEVGTIRGTVDSALVEDEACATDDAGDQANAVYLYAGNDAAPGDVYLDESGEPIARDGEQNPVSAANVEMNEAGLYTYTLGFVETGEYTVAFTCDAILDEPETDDDLTFTDGVNVTVGPDRDATADF